MQPLRPDDLLVRHKPLEDAHWLGRERGGKGEFSEVALERFQVLERQVREVPLTEEPPTAVAGCQTHPRFGCREISGQ